MIKITLKGVNELRDSLFSLENKLKNKVDKELNAFGQNTVNDAKRFAPVNEGFLRNSISFKKEGYKVRIIVAADYAAYLEFGTRGFAERYLSDLPPDWQTFASQFRGGSGGSFDDFVMRIFEWVRKKGMTIEPKQYEQNDDDLFSKPRIPRKKKKKTKQQVQQQLAYVIALGIIKNGIKPQPFLYPAIEKNKIELVKRLNSI